MSKKKKAQTRRAAKPRRPTEKERRLASEAAVQLIADRKAADERQWAKDDAAAAQVVAEKNAHSFRDELLWALSPDAGHLVYGLMVDVAHELEALCLLVQSGVDLDGIDKTLGRTLWSLQRRVELAVWTYENPKATEAKSGS